MRDGRAELMRGSDERTGELFSYVGIEERVPKNRPLRLIRHELKPRCRALKPTCCNLWQ